MASRAFSAQMLRQASQSFELQQAARRDPEIGKRLASNRDKTALDFLRAKGFDENAPPAYLDAILGTYDPRKVLVPYAPPPVPPPIPLTFNVAYLETLPFTLGPAPEGGLGEHFSFLPGEGAISILLDATAATPPAWSDYTVILQMRIRSLSDSCVLYVGSPTTAPGETEVAQYAIATLLGGTFERIYRFNFFDYPDLKIPLVVYHNGVASSATGEFSSIPRNL